MRTEPLTGTVIGHVALSYPKAEYVIITLYCLPLPYTDHWSKSRSEYGVCLHLFLCRLSSIDSWANPKLKDPCQLSLGSIVWPVSPKWKKSWDANSKNQKRKEKTANQPISVSKLRNYLMNMTGYWIGGWVSVLWASGSFVSWTRLGPTHPPSSVLLTSTLHLMPGYECVRFCIITPVHILGMILEQRDECNVVRYLSRLA